MAAFWAAPSTAQVMAEHGIEAIDVVAVNLYPFEAVTARPDCSLEEAIENIDIGGPAMVRAAAKNNARVAVLTEPGDYPQVLAELAGTRQGFGRHALPPGRPRLRSYGAL